MTRVSVAGCSVRVDGLGATSEKELDGGTAVTGLLEELMI
jgi:hypothetical protein